MRNQFNVLTRKTGRDTRPFALLIVAVLAASALAQQNPPKVYVPPSVPQPQTRPAAAQPNPAPTAPAAGRQQVTVTDTGGFLLENVSLLEFIDVMARRLKINYLVDPHFKGGSVTIHTYGEIKQTNLMALLETILHVNGAVMVKTGDLYRIESVEKATQLPVTPTMNSKEFPEDERVVLNLVFLKYATSGEIAKLIQPFLGEGASMASYDPANLLIIQDNSRNMKRTMQLLEMFDNDTFVSQRVRIFDVFNGRPSDLVKQLESVFRAFSLSDKVQAVKFIPVDRIATIIAVAPNPGIFSEVEAWLKKLDIPVKPQVGGIENYVYRLKYSRAETVAAALIGLYSGNPMALISLAAASNSMMGPGLGVASGFGFGGGNLNVASNGTSIYNQGGPYGNMNYSNQGAGGFGYGMLGNAGAYGGGYGGAYGGGYGAYGAYSGYGAYGGTPYVGYNGAVPPQAGGFLGSITPGGLNLTAAMLIGHSRELLAALTGNELRSKAKVISAPSLIATDSIPATMNVGESVPTLTSQAVASGVQVGGTSQFANTISNTSTGVTMNVLARVNSSGVITMIINQDVSTPVPPSASSAIQSDSFTTRNFQTQITLQDGDTVAIGGIIQEQTTESSGGVPVLHRIPIIGAAFGAKSFNTQRTELIVFFTPHVIYDTTTLAEATDDLKAQLKHLHGMMKEQ